jgi:HK97 family phage portal protein
VFLSNGVVVNAPLDTFADITPMLVDGNYYATGSAIELSGVWAAYSELYAHQVWVSTVIRKLAFATARLPFGITSEAETGREPADDSPFAALMARPNERLDSFMLWLWTSSTYDVYGEAYWVKLRDPNGRVRELHPMHPTNLTIKREADGSLTYLYSAGVRNVSALPPIPEADVVPFRNYNPANLTRGLSNLEPLRQTLLNEDAARRATASWWQKGARPSVMLSHPKHLSEDAQSRLRKQVEARHGGADNAGGAMILEEGMTATVVQLTAEEMQYIESRKLNREEVCGAYDVPPPVVHILDKATFSNITEQMRSMYRDTMAPRLGLFESVIDHHLRPDFDASGALVGKFDLDGVLRGDFEARAAAVAPLVTAGVFKPSEARPLFGLPDAGPVADQLYANAALVPLGSVRAAAPLTSTEGQAIASPVQRAQLVRRDAQIDAQRRESRALMGVIGTKATPEAARAALVDAHASAMRELFAKQHGAVSAAMRTSSEPSSVFKASDWNAELEDKLAPLTEATAKAAGGRVARLLGGSFDLAPTNSWLSRNVINAADNINTSTASAIASALTGDNPTDAIKSLLAGDGANARADEIAQSRVTGVGNFAETEAAKQSGGATKTWRVNSGNPRASHAAVDGETVDVADDFSNGMHYPGDPDADVGETAGCVCSLDFTAAQAGGTE